MADRERHIGDSERRLHRVRLGTIGYAGLLAATMVQTFSGRAPTDLAITAAPLLLAAAACLVAAVSPVVARADGAV